MDSKISIGIPIETMLFVVGVLEGSGIIATIAPSRIQVGEVWLELGYNSSSTHQNEAIKQISNTVKEWNTIKYGHFSVLDLFNRLGL